jgi:hypothetical protein
VVGLVLHVCSTTVDLHGHVGKRGDEHKIHLWLSFSASHTETAACITTRLCEGEKELEHVRQVQVPIKDLDQDKACALRVWQTRHLRVSNGVSQPRSHGIVPKTVDQRVHTAVRAQQQPLAPCINTHSHEVQVVRGAKAEKVAMQYAKGEKDQYHYHRPHHQHQHRQALIIKDSMHPLPHAPRVL